MFEPKPGYGLPEPLGFGWIEGADAFVEVDVAVGTGAGAAWPHDQEGGGPSRKAFADIWAACLLANRVQFQVQQQVSDLANALSLRGFDAQPVRLLNGRHLLGLPHRDVAQLGSALRSGRRGRRFESCHPDSMSCAQLSSAPG